ncbi:probable potassium transporter 3 [Brachypodium distachyon]|uniref:probable potassium transporter 3 n=1 Tax=Brachypodium distachyon TaxID=15368 RepID=UPI00052FE68B|nr:probable potassium transporter 3 [Brachypodium distachyon]|eukprot:XP_010230880.1 probable potassium transporter 3 [Brachypodium distachyon]
MQSIDCERGLSTPANIVDLYTGDDPHGNPRDWRSYYKHVLLLAYQSCGVVYGDLSTSPLYVFKSTFAGPLRRFEDEETIFGVFSLVFWTITLIPLLKYVFIVLSADDNGEGGTFALYSLLVRHAKFSLMPNQQAADEELSTYYNPGYTPQEDTPILRALRHFLEKHAKSRTCLLLMVLFGASLVIGDGVLTPAMSVLSSFSGLQVHLHALTNGEVVILSCIVLVGLFALQHCGTHRVAFLFAPVVIVWLLLLGGLGVYNIIVWNPRVFYALSPMYLIRFFQRTGVDGWISLGGVLLSMTGTEAMFADLGHFTATSIRVAFVCLIYPCLVLQYMGQAAFLSKTPGCDIHFIFFQSIPRRLFWPVLLIATLAAIVGSQAVITATFSIVRQCTALGCFPRVKIVHTSSRIHGQIYSPEINWILMFICLAVTIGFRDTMLIGNAYGMACAGVMVVTTLLMALVIVFVWQQGFLMATLFLLAFGVVEAAYLSAAVMKVPQGGWLPLALSLAFVAIMYVWHYGTRLKHMFDEQNKVSLRWIHALGPSLGIVRVPGIGLIYSELATGVPAVFSHFVTNLPAFHQVLVFVCVKAVPVPHVRTEERHLVGRIGPRDYRMYRCVVRYGYKDVLGDDSDFENDLVLRIAEFVQMEAAEADRASRAASEGAGEGRMAVVTRASDLARTGLLVREPAEAEDSVVVRAATAATEDGTLQSLYESESPGLGNRRRVRFEISDVVGDQMDPRVKEELSAIVEAKHAGVAYIMGHSYIKARKSSNFIKKFAINIAYNFLRKNCRGPAVALNIPHISLIEVGMIYYV